MKKVLLVAAAATAVLTAPHTAFTSEFSESGGYHGGSEIGPLGQCFNPRGCGWKDIYGDYGRPGSSAQRCPVVRERIVTASGRVISRRGHTC